jgi:hypothetical protein
LYSRACNHGDDAAGEHAVGYHAKDKSRLASNFVSILRELGTRYSSRLGAWWFDSCPALDPRGVYDATSTDMHGFQFPWDEWTAAAKAFKEVRGDFNYLFEVGKPSFGPEFDREDAITFEGRFPERLEALKIVPPERYRWFRVTGIRRKEEPGEESWYHAALRKLSPAEGSFILTSMRRRSKSE